LDLERRNKRGIEIPVKWRVPEWDSTHRRVDKSWNLR
jgi:hypothetical protein